MARGLAGRGLPSSARLHSPSLGLLRLVMHTAFGVMRVAPSLGCSNMSCYDVATLGRGFLLICPEASSPCLYPPHSLRASLPNG